MKEEILLMASIYDAFNTVYGGFYACTAYKSNIRLQGKFSSEAVKLAKAMGYKHDVDSNGNIEFAYKDENTGITIEIILT